MHAFRIRTAVAQYVNHPLNNCRTVAGTSNKTADTAH
jgi:hypothetical protein